MTDSLRTRIEELRVEGPRRFSRWNAALFDAAIAGPADALARELGAQPDADAVILGYLRVVQQAVGIGAMKQIATNSAGWSSFLERLLVEIVPMRLHALPPARRSAVLVEVWNLGEGLFREPAWVDRYVNACAGDLTRLDELEGFLVRTLDPVLSPTGPASWSGPFSLNVFDLRQVHDEFLPGRLHLAAPTVLCVTDRRRPELQIAVLLRPGKRGEILGGISGLGEYVESGKLPVVQFDDGQVRIAGKSVAVPTLRQCHGFAVMRSGFVAACAEDSQRLWLIESE